MEPIGALSQLGNGDRAKVRDIQRRLGEAPVAANDGGAVPCWLAFALRDALDLKVFLAYRPAQGTDGRWGFGGRVSLAPTGLIEGYEEAIAHFPDPFHYDPLRMAPEQRNRVTTRGEVCQHGSDGECVINVVWPRVGFGADDLLRLLACEGPVVTAWLGGFRPEPFGPRDKAFFTALVPSLRRMLSFRRKMIDAGLARVGFERALALLSMPVFIMSAAGQVEFANPVGTALLESARPEVEARLREALAGRDPVSEVSRLSLPGMGGASLVVLRDEQPAFAHRLALASKAWGISPRELEVMRLLVQGDSNKEIAARLGCHEGSIERHVTSLLRKAGCDSRSRMVARFWATR